MRESSAAPEGLEVSCVPSGVAGRLAMPVFRGVPELAAWAGDCVLAAGVFDGVHRGHRAVLGAAREMASEISGTIRVGVLSFDPHPVVVLRSRESPPLLSPGLEKARLIEDCGMDFLLELPFTPELAAMSAMEFLKLLGLGVQREPAEAMRVRGICCGRDWTFGYQRQGTVDFLRREGDEAGFRVKAVDPVMEGGEPISSTRIRAALKEGRIGEVTFLSGYPYRMEGVVVEGRKLGRELGFPTANLDLPSGKALPACGVYAVRVRQGDVFHVGVANFGMRPTVDSKNRLPTFEVHLLDFSGDLYGKHLEVELLTFIREEKAFASLDELRARIALDIRQARELLSGSGT